MPEQRPEHQIPLFPIAGWDVGASVPKRVVLLRLLYQATDDTMGGPPRPALMHAMTPAQARELAIALLNQSQAMDRG